MYRNVNANEVYYVAERFVCHIASEADVEKLGGYRRVFKVEQNAQAIRFGRRWDDTCVIIPNPDAEKPSVRQVQPRENVRL
jgi:hypothetical protein